MWIELRTPKMYGAIFGFQRCDWWPKCAPDFEELAHGEIRQ